MYDERMRTRIRRLTDKQLGVLQEVPQGMDKRETSAVSKAKDFLAALMVSALFLSGFFVVLYTLIIYIGFVGLPITLLTLVWLFVASVVYAIRRGY